MIHRLRVSCRQGRALLRWCIKRNRLPKRLKKVFDRIRHRAGPLRDADIVVMQLQALSPRQLTRSWWVLWGMAVQWHTQKASEWRKNHNDLYHDVVAVKPLVDEQCLKMSLVPLGKKRCGAKLQKQYDQWRIVLNKAKRPESLHRLRIAGKHLRYALETYPDAHGVNKKRWIFWLKALQDALGQWRDRHLLQTWILDAEKFPMHEIVRMPDWSRFLHSCHKTLSKQIKKNQLKIQKLLQKPPEWADLR
jgi:CHAD domain-containing protein